MGMLAKAESAHEEPAKEKHKKENKHKAKVPKNASEGDEVSNAEAPMGQPALDDDADEGPEEQSGNGANENPDANAEDASEDGNGDAGGSAGAPQQMQDQDGEEPQGEAGEGQPSGEEDQGDQDVGGEQGQPPQGGDDQSTGMPQASQAGAPPPGHIDLSQIQWPDGMKREYMRMRGALMMALFQNDKVANAVLSGIVPQGVHKVESVVHVSLVLFFQINKKLNFLKEAKQLAMPFMQEVVGEVVTLAEQVKQIQFSEQESNMCLSAAQEMLLRIHGVTKQNMKAVASHIPEAQLKDGQAKYQAHAKSVHGITGRFSQPQGQPSAGAGGSAGAPQGGPPGGAAPAPGPTGGEGGTPGGSPQQGAPVTAAPGPGQSAPPGGMLTQAANQPPQGA